MSRFRFGKQRGRFSLRLLILCLLLCSVLALAQWEANLPRIKLDGEVYLLSDGEIDEDILAGLKSAIEKKFKMACRGEKNFMDLRSAYRPERRQYYSSDILDLILPHVKGKKGRVLMVTDKDIYAQGLNWTTGTAICNGTVAVVSVLRLNPTFWTEEENKELHQERVLKIAFHELGHTFGIKGHCRNWNCCLHGSNSIADIDRTGRTYCQECWRTIQSSVTRLRRL